MSQNSPKFPRKKTRSELNEEGRERKRQKKHRGHRAGSRANPTKAKQSTPKNSERDPRLGSKKPIPLSPSTRPSNPVKLADKTPINQSDVWRKELETLENNERLDQLLTQIEQGKAISSSDQDYVNRCLDRVDELMQALGFDLSEEHEEVSDSLDIMHLLK